MFKQLFLFSLLILVSCSTSKYTAETRLLKPSSSNLISIVTGGYGLTQKQAAANAAENAFKTLLIYGVPNSNQETPLLGLNAESKFKKNKKFFDKFLSSATDNFITSKTIRGFKFTNNKAPSTEVEMEINLKSLRDHLISNDIIPKFGL